MVVAILLLSIAIVGGTILTFVYDREIPLLPRLCMGACTGMALMASAGFVVASLFGMKAVSIIVPAIFLLLPLALLLQPTYREFIPQKLREGLNSITTASFRDKVFVSYLGFFLVMAVLLGVMFSHAVYERPDGIYTDFRNNISDLPFHMGIINSFLQGHNFPPQDPAFAGSRFNYPFLPDFLAAMFMYGGASLPVAVWLENTVLGLCLLGMLSYWTISLTSSRLAGLIAPVLVIFSGSMGWWQFFNDIRKLDGGWPPAFFNLLSVDMGHDYSLVNEGNSLFRWGNSMTVLFVPQRSILFGLPICLCIFYLWWKAREGPDATRRMLAAGIAAGLLPLIHAHSFLVVMGMGACLGLIFIRQWRTWLLFAVAACLIGGPEIFWNMHGGTLQTKEFHKIAYGWDHGKNDPVWFWFVNAGPFILLLLGALLWRSDRFKPPKRLLLYYSPFLLLFIIPNVMQLAPWVWDNIKVLFYWYVASVPLVALMLVHIWRTPGKKVFAVVLLGMITMAGVLDVARIVTRTFVSREYDPDEIALAKAIEQHTDPRAIVLYSPGWKPAIYLTGRRSLLGYPGIIWSRGLGRYDDREDAIRSIYTGAPDAEEQIQRWHVQYVEVGPPERQADGMQVNDSFFSRFPLVAEAGPYRLYKVGTAQ